MDAGQGLRRRARVAGALASDGRVQVIEDGPRIHIVFASPAVVYLPYYDPRVAYGRWGWPAHPPVVWAPWPGYRFVPRAPGISVGFWWSSGVRLSVGFFYSDIDWPRREVRVVRVDTWYVHRSIEHRAPQRVVVIRPGRWHHEPTRRHAGYRPRPGPSHAIERSTAPREVRGPENRQPEARRPEPQRADARRPEPRQPEVARPESQRADARRSEPRQPEVRRPEARPPEVARPEPRRPEARERAPSTARAAPPRETRRAEAQQPPAREFQNPASERPRATSQRGPQREARRPEPQREARPAQPQHDETQPAERQPEAQSRSRRAQSAERIGPRSAPERGSRSADEARERQPQG